MSVSDRHLQDIVGLTSIVTLDACTAPSIRPMNISAAIKGANYTDDCVHVTQMSAPGASLGIGGDMGQFLKGGIGGAACCARLSGGKEVVSVKLKVGGVNDSAENFRTYIRDVTVIGTMAKNRTEEPHRVLIVRFFPNHEVQAELLPSNRCFGPDNLRIDKFFSRDQRSCDTRKTEMQSYSQTQSKRLTLLLISIALLCGACAPIQMRGYIDATAWSANYTEDYIREFHIQTADGQDTGLEGVQINEFSKGGQGGHECCSLIPGVGQKIRLVWTVANTESKALWKTYSQTLVVKGATSNDPDSMNFIIVRFFPDHNVEAEFISESLKFGAVANPRVDAIFYGRRVMRYIGE